MSKAGAIRLKAIGITQAGIRWDQKEWVFHTVTPGISSFSEPSGGTKPADTLNLDFQPPEM